MKLRTAWTNEQIAKHFKVSAVTIVRMMEAARQAMQKDFTPLFLRHRTREEMVQNKTEICQKLYTSEHPEAIVLICDGTYIFINKSADLIFQRLTYSAQKKRNFVKIMVIVAADGYIENVYGFYEAKTNDGKILKSILNEAHSELDACLKV